MADDDATRALHVLAAARIAGFGERLATVRAIGELTFVLASGLEIRFGDASALAVKLAVVRAGTAWGNPACYGQGGSACTGVPATTASLDAHAAVGGVAIVSGQLGTTVGTSALVQRSWSTARSAMRLASS